MSSIEAGGPVEMQQDVFVRRATGLVRAVPQRAAWVF